MWTVVWAGCGLGPLGCGPLPLSLVRFWLVRPYVEWTGRRWEVSGACKSVVIACKPSLVDCQNETLQCSMIQCF